MQPKPGDSQLPAALQTFELPSKNNESFSQTPRAGMRCPNCSKGILDYDGLLNLVCPVCHYQSASGGGCT